MNRPLLEKTCLITGANRGIGKATALGLAERGATVLMACRSVSSGEDAASEIRRQVEGASIHVLHLDLGSFTSMREFSSRLREEGLGIDVLIHNAVICPRRREVSVDGLELQFAVNHLAPMFLTLELLDRLQETPSPRVVVVASRAHKRVGLDLEDLQATNGYRPYVHYARTKLANILFTKELARRLADEAIDVNCLHPGVIATKLLADILGPLRFLSPLLGKGIAHGAETTLHVACSPELQGVSGEYFSDCRLTQPSSVARDPELARRLWDASMALFPIAPRETLAR